MFNFTTQTVLNSVKKATIDANNKKVPNGSNLIINTTGKTPKIRIGNLRFDTNDILDKKIEVKLPTPEALAKVTFNMADVIPTEGETTARIVLYLGLSMNNQDALYANSLTYKGKPIYLEFPVKAGETAAVIATRAKKIVEKFLIFTMGEKILDIELGTGDDAGKLTIKATNGYQIFKKALLQIYNPESKTVDCCTYAGEFETVKTGVPVKFTVENGVITIENKKLTEDGLEDLATNEVPITPGAEAFGDYNWILHNLRLPTAANYYPWSGANRAGEMPVPGQVYTQFIVRLKKERDGIMGEIVGARGTSVTTHVFYAAGTPTTNNSAAKEVYDAFKTTLGLTEVNTADNVLNDPYQHAED